MLMSLSLLIDARQLSLFAEMNVSDILNEPIQGNILFSYKNQCLLFKEMIESKILFVKDLIIEEGCLKSEHELFQEKKYN